MGASHLLALTEARSPIVPGAPSITCNEQILRIKQRPVRPCINLIDDPRLEVDQHRAGDIVLVVGLIEENVLAIVDSGAGGVRLEKALRGDAMLEAELVCEEGLWVSTSE